jgi:hypothetical protein
MKIQLTAEEQSTLRSLAFPPFGQLPAIARYWQSLYASRGLACPKGKIPVAEATSTPGKYRITFHAKPLGPAAIAAGKAFRALNDRKTEEFEQKLRERSGRAS